MSSTSTLPTLSTLGSSDTVSTISLTLTPAGRFSAEALEAIRRSPDVAYVEHDQVVTTQEELFGVDDALDGDIKTQIGAPWGLARISHRKELGLGTFNKYEFDINGGEGVTAYVVDTGINIDHVEFEGRASWGKTIPRNDVDKDGNGHGTHCAGTIASRKYGVAKKADVVAVKVLGSNGSGSMSDVVGGVLWAAEDAAKRAKDAAEELRLTGKTKYKGSVANMSLGGGKSKGLDDAVNAAVDSGLHFAVAAGNDNKDACDYSPAAAERAVTVGASTIGDQRAYFSNHGKCVDVFAPGLNILSTWNGGNQSTNTISGTSMASPHVCGLLAYLLSIEGSPTFTIDGAEELVEVDDHSLYHEAYNLAYEAMPELVKALLPEPVEQVPLLARRAVTGAKITPKALKKAVLELSTKGVLTDLPALTPNLLIFNNATK